MLMNFELFDFFHEFRTHFIGRKIECEWWHLLTFGVHLEISDPTAVDVRKHPNLNDSVRISWWNRKKATAPSITTNHHTATNKQKYKFYTNISIFILLEVNNYIYLKKIVYSISYTPFLHPTTWNLKWKKKLPFVFFC